MLAVHPQPGSPAACARDRDRVFHTYSAYARGVDPLIGTYAYLDLTPLGRQKFVVQFPYHDSYDSGS